ncbi:MAG: phosphoribosylformylglycinamidine synthase subunit PurQ [Trueperaceae bacterium]
MIAVIRFPGSNCDEDARWALEGLGGDARMVWHREVRLEGVDAVVLPGGFSYGDYLRSGAIAAQSPIMAAVREFAQRGGPVLGICNGFQVLTESGLLPGALARNSNPHFLCRPVGVRVERTDLPFTSGYELGQVLSMPVAHAEGSYFADAATLAQLEARRGVVFRYCAVLEETSSSTFTGSGRPNPNGSLAGIAGIVNERGNVLGMMPHPERAVEGLLGGTDGRLLLSAMLSGHRRDSTTAPSGWPAPVA